VLKVAFADQKFEKNKVFEWFKSRVTLAEDTKCSEHPPTAKHMKIWTESRTCP
jgi:hypothetical protein